MQNNTEEAAKQYAKKHGHVTPRLGYDTYRDLKLAFIAGLEFADASKEEPKGLQELRDEKKLTELLDLHYGDDKAAVRQNIRLIAVEYAKHILQGVSNQIPNNEELTKGLIKALYDVAKRTTNEDGSVKMERIFADEAKAILEYLKPYLVSGVSNTQSDQK